MTRPVVRRGLADRDIADALAYYADTAGEAVALRFVDSLHAAFAAIGRQPAAGSPRYAEELGVHGLRSRRLARFPFLVFYADAGDRIEVWRVLHAQRDIPSAWSLDEPSADLGG
ncbi:MAG: plasmid stabilization protein [Phenylobacterium zucineum]|nr:MAG: plasmid stabilization protein [Phenylobacterium zucineum]